MKADDMIFDAIYKPAMSGGASERAAKDCAVIAMNDYRKGKYKNIKTLVENAIKQAKKL